MTSLAIVITDFNGYAHTRRCLGALHAGSCNGFSVIVVDHGTTGETAAGLAREFPGVVRLQASPELWWAGATNVGIRHALAQGVSHVMLLNNDCCLGDDSRAELLELSRQHPDMVIAPVQRNLRSGQLITILPRCSLLLGFPTLPGPLALTPELQAARLVPVGLIAGGRGAIVPAAVFERVGLLDEEHLPHYWADHDFYLRAVRRQVPLRIATRATVDVDDSSTTSAKAPERLDLAGFVESLKSIRSHRNIAHVAALFRKHYPLRPLYPLGVMLYTGRYMLVWILRRMVYLSGLQGRGKDA